MGATVRVPRVFLRHSVDEVQLLELPKNMRRDFRSKSGAVLTVAFQLPLSLVNQLLSYERDEIEFLRPRLPPGFEIKGLREYRVQGIPAANVGAKEFHRVRTEVVFSTRGKVRWICEDVRGGKREFILMPRCTAVLMPPGIYHVYEDMGEGSDLSVVANTQFDPDDKNTQDSYLEPEFRELQERFRGE